MCLKDQVTSSGNGLHIVISIDLFIMVFTLKFMLCLGLFISYETDNRCSVNNTIARRCTTVIGTNLFTSRIVSAERRLHLGSKQRLAQVLQWPRTPAASQVHYTDEYSAEVL